MYRICVSPGGDCECEVQIQDGHEWFSAASRQEAIFKVIRAARTLNHDFITEKDIVFSSPAATPETCLICKEWETVRRRIKAKELYLIEHDDKRLLYKITPEECELILGIREGRVKIIPIEFALAPGEVLFDDPLLGKLIIRANDPRAEHMQEYILARGDQKYNKVSHD